MKPLRALKDLIVALKADVSALSSGGQTVGSQAVLEVLATRRVEIDVVQLEPVEPEPTRQPRALAGSNVADDARNRSRFAGRNVEVADGEEAGRVQETLDSVEKGQVVGHHAANGRGGEPLRSRCRGRRTTRLSE